VITGAPAEVPFSFTLSADDAVRTKPRPDPYRAAADRFGAAPHTCVAVGDTPDGTRSAEAAGCAVLVVPSPLPVPASPGRVLPGAWRTWISRSSACVSRRVTGSRRPVRMMEFRHLRQRDPRHP
jgi:beta-phosphoglucomutase-like phosphatase (HAD superfamily)